MVTLLEETYPEYYGYFIYKDKHGRKRMYSESKKAIHGTLEASLIFWGKRSKNDKKWDIREMNTTGVS